MIERTKMIDEINILYNEISRLQCLLDNALIKLNEKEIPICSECDHYEDHHTSLACANCPVITKVWGGF